MIQKPFALVTLLCILNACSADKSSVEQRAKLYTKDVNKHAFSKAIKLTNEQEDFRILGKSFFTKPWVEAPATTTARDGLGPLFSANSCIHCHTNHGAGVVYDKKGNVHRSLVMRLSVNSDKHEFIPEPMYGEQLSLNGTSGVKYEGSVKLSYTLKKGTFMDGEPYFLHEPHYQIIDLQYGPMHKDVNVAPHIALALVGLGAIEEIDAEDILKNEDIDDRDADGISGKANWVVNPETNESDLGRYTWKAAAVTLKQQVANAAHNDMGLSNPLYPSENFTKRQEELLNAVKQKDGVYDLPMHRLDAITYYLKTFKIPSQRKSKGFEEGQEIFKTVGCVKCHSESFTTQKYGPIHPYSDFLLHNMGEALSDGQSLYLAQANEFRTPPLWGIGLYKRVTGELNLLHDGRAKSIAEAILWHGGEAQKQRETFKGLSKQKREALLEFLEGI